MADNMELIRRDKLRVLRINSQEQCGVVSITKNLRERGGCKRGLERQAKSFENAFHVVAGQDDAFNLCVGGFFGAIPQVFVVEIQLLFVDRALARALDGEEAAILLDHE